MRYEEIVEKIVEATGKSKEEVWELIEKKRAEMDYLISEEGAAHILASELGIDLTPKLKVEDLSEGMRGVNVILRVLKVFGKREWEKADRKGKVLNLLAGDETGKVLVSLWDENADVQVEEGDVLKILGGYVVKGRVLYEIRAGKRARVIVNPPGVEGPKVREKYVEKVLKDIREGERIRVVAMIARVFERPVVVGDKLVLSFVLDDGTAAVRAVCFNETVEKLLGASREEIIELYNLGGFQAVLKKIPVLEDLVWYGRVQKNTLREELEIVVRGVEKLDPWKVIESELYA